MLVHGLWHGATSQWLLARRLRKAGLRTHIFNYSSRQEPEDEAAERLAGFIQSRLTSPVHVLAHSLGGLVSLAALLEQDLPMGRIVLLGPPLRGSRVARKLQDWPVLGSRLFGAAGPLLAQGAQMIPPGREIGVITGHRAWGAGRVLGILDRRSDGTVAHEESSLPGAADTISLPTSHTGLLFNSSVAEEAVRFFRHGRFGSSARSPVAES